MTLQRWVRAMGGERSWAATERVRHRCRSARISCSYMFPDVPEQRVAKAWLDMTRGEDQNHTE